MADIEHHRLRAMKRLFNMKSFAEAWPVWRPMLAAKSGNFLSPHDVLKIGSNLSEVFLATSKEGREQGTVSAAGAAWEGLTCWYLNLVLSGTNAIAVKQAKKLVPSPVSDALTVNYNTFQANTESDVLVLVFPVGFDFPNSLNSKHCEAFDKATRDRIGEIEAHVVQCKTNWNDNSQVPMLWDMIYKSKGFKPNGLTLGKNDASIEKLKNFSYSFMTVPTQKKDQSPKTDAVHVNRVRHLSGGNYWGRPTISGIAFGLDEFFNKNVPDLFPGTVGAHISESISKKVGWFSEEAQTLFMKP